MAKQEQQWGEWEQKYDADGNPTHMVRHPILTREEYERRLRRVGAAMLHLYAYCLEHDIPWDDSKAKPMLGKSPYPDLQKICL